jgi:hypothetical protein
MQTIAFVEPQNNHGKEFRAPLQSFSPARSVDFRNMHFKRSEKHDPPSRTHLTLSGTILHLAAGATPLERIHPRFVNALDAHLQVSKGIWLEI